MEDTMANLITLETEQAPLASGDEMTPSLEYTLDDPPPPPGDDDTERDQPTPSSHDKSSLMFDDPPPPPSADSEIMQPIPVFTEEQPSSELDNPESLPLDEESFDPHHPSGYQDESFNPHPPGGQDERFDPHRPHSGGDETFDPQVPSGGVDDEPQHQSPMEPQPPPVAVEEFKPSAIVMPTQMTIPDKDNIPEIKQPIYEEVSERPDNNPEQDKNEMKNNPGDDEKEGTEKDEKDEKHDKDDKEKKEKEKGNPEKGANDIKEVEEGKEADAESVDRAEVRIPPPVAPMPKHRSRCVACGCPKVCCVRNFVFLWIVIFILIQAGPLAVLVLDLLSMNVEGTTISRYIAEWDMKPAVCKVSSFQTTDFKACDCLASSLLNCTALIKDYGCMDVKVKLFKYEQTGPFTSDVFLWKSEREYVLDTYAPRCYNLDICSIDKTIPWYEYRNGTEKDGSLIRNKLLYNQEGFVCYYKKKNDGTYVAIKDRNTSFWDVLLWFILPLAGILICWLVILFCLCWYCCPRQRCQEQGGKKHNGGYQEVENVEEGSADHDHDVDAMKENLILDDAGEHMQAGKWPMSGPAAACM